MRVVTGFVRGSGAASFIQIREKVNGFPVKP